MFKLKISGSVYFLPINWLPMRKQTIIAHILRNGLHALTEFTKKKTFFGKITINLKKQDLIGKLNFVYVTFNG